VKPAVHADRPALGTAAAAEAADVLRHALAAHVSRPHRFSDLA
jgi:hypothetical protein